MAGLAGLGSVLAVDGFRIDAALLDYVERRYGDEARGRVTDWQRLLESSQGLSEREKLREVNRFFNQLRFTSDEEQWGKEDYWATPIEFLAGNAGDCEDFSVAKYFSLRELGVPLEKLSLTYVKALKLNQAHMVVTYYATPDAEPLVLDNLVPDIRAAGRRKDLLPVYSFNGESLWLAKERGRGRLVGDSSRLSLWTDLIERMEALPGQGGVAAVLQ